MDINQNLEQINTFEKGMNTDTSDALLPNNQYRYAENLRFTSHNTDNTGEMQPIKDLELVYDIKEDIIAASLIRNYAIFITQSKGEWSIYTLDKDNINDGAKCIFGPCNAKLGKDVSIVTRWENEKCVKVYIADGINLLMSINIFHDDGEQKDIKYLTSYNELKLPQIIWSETTTSGGLKPAIILYTYVLYKEGGAVTKYAPLTSPIYLLNENGEGYLDGEVTNTAIIIEVGVEGNLYGLDHIQVYRITYSQYGQDPDISIIYDDKFNGYLNYTDTGVDIVKYSKSEFLKSETYDKIKPSTIESKGNYLFAGNIEDFLDEIDAQWDGIDFTNKYYVDLDILYGEYGLDFDGKLRNGQYCATLKPGETYRYGIVLYDESGRRSTVKFVKDLNIPNNKIFIYGHQYYEVTPIGIKVTVLNIPHCSGYEIVRCLRGVNESHSLYLGIIGFPVGHDTRLSTPSFLSRTMLYPCADKVKSNKNVIIFACPEAAYLPEETLQKISSVKTLLEGVADYKTDIENISKEAFNYVNRYGDYFIEGSDDVLHSLDDETIDDGYNLCYWENQSPCDYIMNIAVGKSIYSNDQKKRATFKINVPLTVNRKYYYNEDSVDNLEGGEVIDNPFFIDIDLTGPVLHDTVVGSNIDRYQCPYAYTDYFAQRNIMTWSSIIMPKDECVNTVYKSTIHDAKVVDSFKPGDLLVQNDSYVGWDTYTSLVGLYTYCNFVKEVRNIDWVGGFEYGSETWCNTYAGGKALILNTDSEIPSNADPKDFIDITRIDIGSVLSTGLGEIKGDVNDLLQISVANIKNNSYIGYGPVRESTFWSFGNYFNYDQLLKNIFDGDTYVNVFTYNHTHTVLQADKWQCGASIVYQVPIESSIDLLKASGDILPKLKTDHNYFLLDYMGNMFNKYIQEKDAYLYNAAYSQEMNLMPFNIVYNTEVYSGKFDTRIKCSEEKSNGEKFDNWLNFSVVNTIDVDTRFGEITHLKLFKDWLIFWQKEATGLLSVNERVIILDVNDTNLLLGSGGILLRYDYLTTKYGMLFGKIAETLSDTTLYWWDSYKKEILAYSGGQVVQPMTEAKTIRNYINNNNNTNKPMFVYDSHHNEILMNAVNESPIVYNEYAQSFTSIYTDYIGLNSVYFNDLVWLTDGQCVQKINAGDYIEAKLLYVVNKNCTEVKVFDNTRLGLGLVSNNYKIHTAMELPDQQSASKLLFTFKSPLQYSRYDVTITDREYDYRFAIPRALIYDSMFNVWKDPAYGQRIRGKYMLVDLIIPQHPNTSKNAISLLYITTKYRISYS